MGQFHGNPCWYELTTGKGDLKAAEEFYTKVLGWQVSPADVPGFDYHLARAGGEMVAGLMEMPDDVSDMPPMWMIYFAVDDVDQTAKDITAAGGSIFREPADIPGTGRFAIAADPQGAAFGVLQPDMSRMSEADRKKAETTGAFDQAKPGHGNWNELMSTDPAAALVFYTGLFGWTKGEAMDMGEMGTYQLLRHKSRDIGAMMGLGDAPVPNWLPYFGVNGSVGAVMETIRAEGGHVHHGPQEVPGGAWIAIGHDPQGAWFAVVGPEK
ncbi:MAG: VOC family protein [Paracoccus sp. (in: a-proteobacteria)]|nr:VOC family protein [Paracoccus sp. (in: a-proteobacteria)]